MNNRNTKLDMSTNDELKNQIANGTKPMLPAVLSWATFKKRNPDIQYYSWIDGTLGIKYSVEPTMRNLGYRQLTINERNDLGISHSIYEKPKQFVIDWLSKNTEYHKYKECVFYVWYVRRESATSHALIKVNYSKYVWYVRRESATRCIDVFLK